MKRPLAIFGFTLFLSLLTASVSGTVPSLILSGVLFLCFILSFFLQKGEKKQVFILVFFTFTLGLILFNANNWVKVQPVQKLIGTNAVIEAELTKPVSHNGKNYVYYLKTRFVSQTDAPQKTRVVVTSKERLQINVSDTVKMHVQFLDNTASSKYAEGYYLRGYALGNVLACTQNQPRSPAGLIAAFQVYLQVSIKELLPGDAGAVIISMVLGDSSGLGSRLKAIFSESGVYHLFAVSGLHVSLWGALAFWMLRKLRLGLKPAALLSSLVILFYMALTGFSMSVMRAGIMLILMLAGRAFLKVPDSVNSLGLAVAVTCFLYPMAVCSVSFLLTVSASLGIVTMGRTLCKKYTGVFDRFPCKEGFRWLLNSVLLTFSLTLFTLPVQMIYFKTFVPLSLITNLIFIPLGTVTIVLGGFAAVCAGLPLLAMPFSFFAGLGAKTMIFFARAFYEFPVTSVGIGAPYLILWLGGSMVLLGFAFLIRRNGSLIKLTAILSAALLIVSITGHSVLNRNLLKITILDVGAGVSVLFTHQTQSFLVGCGGSYDTAAAVTSALKQENRKTLDLLIVPRGTEQESSKLSDVTRGIAVTQVVLPEEHLAAGATAQEILVHTNLTIDFTPSLRVEYRYMENHFCVFVTFGDSRVLITDSRPEQAILDTGFYQGADVLISGTALPKGIAGRLNILSGDWYGHDKAAKYRSRGIQTVATGDRGNLHIKLNQNGSYQIRRQA